MAEKYTIQIQPQISSSDARKMDNDLNKRFSDVAKKFGTNLGNSMKTGIKFGLGALGVGSVAALLTNPFEKINQDLNETLDRFDNSAQKAEQFGVDSAKYFRAERIAESFGVKDFETIINRFSSSLEAARTGQDKTLENFIGDKDVVDSFIAFTQSLSSMKADDRNAALDRVFGGKIGLRVGDLAAQSTESLQERKKQIFGNTTDQELAKELKKMETLKDLQDINQQKLIVEELRRKSAAISTGTINAQFSKGKAELNRETQQLSQYQIFANMASAQERMATSIDAIKADITSTLMPVMEKLVEWLPVLVDYARQAIEWLTNIVKAIKNWRPW